MFDVFIEEVLLKIDFINEFLTYCYEGGLTENNWQYMLIRQTSVRMLARQYSTQAVWLAFWT
jgi:hypothetical protein